MNKRMAATSKTDDRVYGLGGTDVINTGEGNDYTEGGDDTLNGDEGIDVLDGGAGGDIYVIDEDGGSDLIQGTDHTGDSIQLAA